MQKNSSKSLNLFVAGTLTALATVPFALAQQQPGFPNTPNNAGSSSPQGQYPSGSPAQNPVNPQAPAVTSNNPSPFAADLSQNGAAGADTQGMKDRIFVRKASDGGYAEVQLGTLAVQKGSSDEVKKFGQKMVDDHTRMNADMKPFADQLGVRAPTKLSKMDQDEYDKLNGLSGADFDKEYLGFMLKDHRKDLHEFRTEEASTSNAELKTTVGSGMKVIGEHLQMVITLAKANGLDVSRPKPGQ